MTGNELKFMNEMETGMTTRSFGIRSAAPKVTVILPTYKPGYYIYRALKSLVNQTLDSSDWELVIILNGCDEPYLEQLTQYIRVEMGKLDVTLIHTLRGGVSNARNLGLDMARGEYVTFVDDDDYFSPAFLEGMYMGAHGADMVLSDALSFEEGRDDVFNYDYEEHRAYEALARRYGNDVSNPSEDTSISPIVARKYYNVPFAKIIRRSCIGSSRFNTDFRNGEDSLFMFDVSQRIRTTRLSSPESIYYHCMRPGSAWRCRRQPREVISTGVAQVKEVIRIYRRAEGGISRKFWLQRIAGLTKGTMIHLLR